MTLVLGPIPQQLLAAFIVKLILPRFFSIIVNERLDYPREQNLQQQKTGWSLVCFLDPF